MSFLSTLRKLILGETWVLPVGITVVVLLAAFVVKPLLGSWQDTGGFVLLAAVCAVLVASVSSSAG